MMQRHISTMPLHRHAQTDTPHVLIYLSSTDITFLSPERRTCNTQPTVATPPTACVSTVHPGDALPIKGTDPWQRGSQGD